MRGNLERRLDKLERATAPERGIVTVYAWAGALYDRWPWNPDARELDAGELAALQKNHAIWRVVFDDDWGEQCKA